MSFSKYVLENTNKELSTLENKEIYIQLLNYVKEQADKKALNSDKKKVLDIRVLFTGMRILKKVKKQLVKNIVQNFKIV